MVEELAGLGFAYIELSHGIRMTLVPGILQAVEEGLVKISSTHNFCPLPSGVQHAAPNFYQPSAPNKGELRLWHTYTEKTLAFTRQVRANHVVLHSGGAFFFLGKPTARLDALEAALTSGEDGAFTALRENEAYRKALGRVVRKVKRKFLKAGPRVVGVIQAVLDTAREHDLFLCIENREGVLEFPPDDEILAFVEALAADSAPVRYWHDAGHAQIKHLMGALEHDAHLEMLGPLLAGFHLHDVNSAGRDHMPIGTGTIDWKMIRRHIRPEHRLVLELSPKLKPGQVEDSRKFMEDLLG